MTDRDTGVAGPPDAPTNETFDAYLAAIRAGDRRAALRVIDRAQASGLGLRELYLGVFQPALREIGRLWQENVLTVAEEHLATAITRAAMVRVYSGAHLPEPSGPLLIAACAENERHEVGLQMLCDFLDLEGWDTVFLGATVPRESLLPMVSERRPDVVALSASLPPHLPQLRETIRELRAVAGPDQPLILVGGRPFLEHPELATTLGADLTGRDAAETARLLADRFRAA